jgi:SH3-like domain-containing protein
MGWKRAGAFAALALLAAQPAQAQKAAPYWASIAAGEAKMRTGPGRNFPSSWVYKRRDLPVKVIEVYPSWRKVQDPDGTTGWMLAALLSDDRTAIVTGEVRPLRALPEPNAKIVWRAEPGVVGRISDCANGWCAFDTGGRKGYVEIAHIWGVGPGEDVR